MGAESRRTFATSVVRWALATRVASLLVVLLLPGDRLGQPRVVLAVALLAGWSLLWLSPRGGTLRVVQRHPLIAVGDALMAVTVTALVGVESPLVFATLSTALVIGVLFRPLVAALVTLTLVSGYVLVAIAQATRDERFVFMFVIPATYAVLALLGGVTRHLHERVLAEQARLVESLESAAASAERARLAREMHDSVAKSLHGVALAAAALPRWIHQDPDQAVRQADAIQEAAKQASAEARELLVALRTVQEGPLVEQLTELVTDFRSRTGIETVLSVRDLADLDPGVTHEVLLIVGESLENVRRHSRAGRVLVDLDGTEQDVTVQVADDGAGFDPDHVGGRRFGVLGMRERAESVGAELTMSSAMGEGTTVTLRIPQVLAQGGTS